MPLLYQLSAPEKEAEEERLVIDLTTSESEFSAELHSRGFIRSPLAFNIFLTLRGGKGKIEPGAYLVSKSMNALKLIEIDATVQYALEEPGNWWPLINLEDYKVDSPYNTYLYQGRPPAPICNPGLAAIEAVVFPEETDYLYYLHDENGKIHPALTYEEHLGNVDKYLKKTEDTKP